MKDNTPKNVLQNIRNSKFVRSIFLRMVSILLIVMIAIIAITFFSFTTEINKNSIAERQKLLENIEESITKRIEEISSISYNIGIDKTFYLDNVTDDTVSGYEMSKTLGRYLVGNDFIEHLAYYRLAEPDTIYVSIGELSFHNFWNSYLGVDDETANQYIDQIKSTTRVAFQYFPIGDGEYSYFSYVCPLPQFSTNPQAFVLMLIPASEIKSILDTELSNCYGSVAIFDSDGSKLYQTSNLDYEVPLSLDSYNDNNLFSYKGKRYIRLETVSSSNGWTYVTVIRINDMVSKLASRELIFILLLLVLMIVAIFAMLINIIKQYNPISNLARTLSDESSDDGKRTLIDEESLLSDTFATLKDDSAQKQKFEAAYHEAEAANKAKSTFLSNMSHDIRTPMNAIVGMTEIAYKNADDPVYVKECLQNVRISSQYLLDILNNVLDMSRIESGKLTLANDVVELPKLIHGIITIINHSLEVKSQKLLVETENIVNEKIIGDTVRITQIFMNILTNSIKFTPNGGTISLRMSQTGITDDGYGDYIFTFLDTGIGMSPDFVDKVFGTFTRDEKAGIGKIEGTGLGMAIAKNFVELMGGTITCKSKLNKGTTFTITMHLKLAEDESLLKPPENYKYKSILIFGDEEVIVQNQVKLFKSLLVKTQYAFTISSALELAENARILKTPFDYIIINQMDADKSGLLALSQFIKISGSKKTSYILAARDMLCVEKSSAFDSGISAFVQRPLFRSTAINILNKNIIQYEHQTNNKIVDMTGMHILLVEDNKINRQIAHTLLKETHAEVIEATNGREAVDIFKKYVSGYFSIILMDVQMPVMNGYEATAAIRSIDRNDASTVPIFAMTANTFDEDVRQVRESGMNGHLGKPYAPDELYALLKQALE